MVNLYLLRKVTKILLKTDKLYSFLRIKKSNWILVKVNYPGIQILLGGTKLSLLIELLFLSTVALSWVSRESQNKKVLKIKGKFHRSCKHKD